MDVLNELFQTTYAKQKILMQFHEYKATELFVQVSQLIAATLGVPMAHYN